MPSMADVWLRLGLEGNQLIADASRQGAKAGDAFGATFKSKAKDIGKGLSPTAFAGVAVGAVAAFASVQALTNVFGDSTEAALKDEESIARLGAALKANIPSWNGNTAAIERTLKARMALGFTDEDQRDSLARLVAATHDVNKALEIQSTAMDLARFKGISLAEAGDALTKVEAGSFRILKSLGIELRAGATQTEALAAVQRVATGQAEAYANTNRGKLLVSQVEVGEAMEKLGTAILPGVVAVMLAGANAATDLAEGAGPVVKTLTDVASAAQAVGEALDHLAGSEKSVATETDLLGSKTTFLGQVLHNMADKIAADNAATLDMIDGGHRLQDSLAAQAAAAENASTNMIGLGDDYRASAAVIGNSLDTVGDKAGDMAGAVASATISAAQSMQNLRKNIVASAMGIIDGAYSAITTADQLAGTNAEINAQRRIIAMGGAASGTDRATAALDRQAKALDAASKAETAHTSTLTAAIDKQIAQLDLSEKQLAIEERKRGLNEQLNQATLDLAKAQKGGPGGVDAQAVSDAMAKIQDIKEQQAENERQLAVAAKRDVLEAQKAEIEAKSQGRQDELSKLKAALSDQRQAMNSSGGASVADAKVRLHELFKTQADEVLALALAGHMGSKEVADALVDMHNRLATASADEKIAILATIKALEDLEKQAVTTFLQFPSGAVVLRPVGAKGGPTVSDAGPSGAAKPFVPRNTIVPPMSGFTNGKPIELLNVLQIDGREVARSTSRYQADDMNR